MTQQHHDTNAVRPFDLVPMAERPALQAADYMETEEQTIWFNPFDHAVAVQVHIGSTPMLSGSQGAVSEIEDIARARRWHSIPAAQRREMQTGIRTYVIPPKSMRAIPSDFDMAIQRTECMHPECLGRKMYCKNREHTERMIVGGLYPRLINKGTQRMPLTEPPRLHPALDDEKARAAEALERAKRKLQEAQNAKDMALVAHADLVEAQKDIATAEARLAEQQATEGVISHQKKIIEALGPSDTSSKSRASK